jgi:hypothetical protein
MPDRDPTMVLLGKRVGVTGGRYSARPQPFLQLQKLERQKLTAQQAQVLRLS